MKYSFLIVVLFSIASLCSFSAHAQFEEYNQQEITETPKPEVPEWVSDKGYWVVKSNKNTPKECTVYFYNNEKILVYQEEIKDQKLKLTRKKTLMKLKAALEESVDSYAKGVWARSNGIVVRHLQ